MIAPKIIIGSDDEEKNFKVYDVKIVDLNTHIEVRRYDRKMLVKKHDRKVLDPMIVKALADPGFIELNEKENKTTIRRERGSSFMFREDNLQQSFTRLRNLALANKDDFKTFITLTFGDNLTDLTKANRHFNSYITQIRKKFKDLKYIGVPEFQERGAVHYHIMCNLVPGSDLMPLRPHKRLWDKHLKKWLEMDYYDLPHWSYGYSSAFTLDNVDQNFSITGYLAKYFWKSIKELRKGREEGTINDVDLRLFNRIKVLRSRNLITPSVAYADSIDDECYLIEEDLQDHQLIRSAISESKSDYVPSVEISEYKKTKIFDITKFKK